mgnify:CR=1 FL=1
MAINALLQHEIDRFGVITVMDVTLFDIISKKPVLFLDTLKMSNITAEGQQKDIKGGKYADLLLSYNFGRSVSIEFQDGGYGGSGGYSNNVVVSNAGLIATGYAALAAADLLYAWNVTDEVEIDLTTATIASGTVTFSTAPGTTDQVTLYFKNAAPVDANYTPMEAILKSSSFPKTVKLVGRTFIMEQRTGQMVEIEIEVPKLKLASNFTLSFDAEGDASVFDFSGMALIDGAEKDVFKIRTIGYSDVVNA